MTSYNHKFLTDALANLAPDSKWIIKNGELEWIDDEEFKPSDEQIEAKVQEFEAAEPMRLLRVERDRLIAETDWWVLPDRTPTSEQLAYRQALRDLPDNSSPVLDPTSRIGISGVSWPVKP